MDDSYEATSADDRCEPSDLREAAPANPPIYARPRPSFFFRRGRPGMLQSVFVFPRVLPDPDKLQFSLVQPHLWYL